MHVLQGGPGQQPRHHAFDRGHGVEARLGGRGLGLDHRELRVSARCHMHRDVVGRPPGDQVQAEQALRLVMAVQGLQGAGDVVHRLALQQGRQRPADHVLKRHAQVVRDVGRRVLDGPVRAGGEQEAEALHRAQEVDRLAVATPEVQSARIGFSRRGGRVRAQ